MTERELATTRELCDFIRSSPTAFQAVETVSKSLDDAGFTRLEEGGGWNIRRGGRYYLTKNLSTLIAFQIPERGAKSFMIAASHSDSPTFKLKESFEAEAFGKYIKLNTEPYGGMIMSSWFDRPLSVAGRVVISENGVFTAKPVMLDRDLLLIPNVAIHFNRTLNDGYKYDPSCDTLPLMSALSGKDALKKLLAEECGTEPEKIAGMDIYLYNRAPGVIWGTDNEFFSAPRIDNLMCAFAALQGFLQAENGGAVQVYALFDNEETGSATKQGAGSVLLQSVLTEIAGTIGADAPDGNYRRMLASSFMLSADNAHARHPNHPELSDALNAPNMNEGVVIKSNAAQRYTTDGLSSAVFAELCRRAGVPVQYYANRSNIAGGSTLGSIADTNLPVNTVDIGLAQLAMHSSFETAGCADTAYMIAACKAFYETTLHSTGDGKLHIC